jgi:hypothetical protein
LAGLLRKKGQEKKGKKGSESNICIEIFDSDPFFSLLNRSIDSEAKILNNIATKLGDNTSASGTINLLTERALCASCSNVIQQFQAKYPNITVNVMDNGGVMPPTKKGP